MTYRVHILQFKKFVPLPLSLSLPWQVLHMDITVTRGYRVSLLALKNPPQHFAPPVYHCYRMQHRHTET
jgi:hypothetical protein